MGKTYDEQIATLQKKIAEVKAKKAREEKLRTEKIGQALVDRFPGLLKKMDEEGFNIFEYVKTKDFANAVYSAYKSDEDKKADTDVAQAKDEEAATKAVDQSVPAVEKQVQPRTSFWGK